MPQVTMPQLGEGVEQGTIGKWLKAVGDHVRIGDPLVEVVTDKVNAEVPSPFEGTLTRILVGRGRDRRQRRGHRGGGGGRCSRVPAAAPEPAAAPAPPASSRCGSAHRRSPAASPPRRPAPGRRRPPPRPASIAAQPRPAAAAATAQPVPAGIRMTPAVRRLARDRGVDVTAIGGSGKGGRITRETSSVPRLRPVPAATAAVRPGGRPRSAAAASTAAARRQPADSPVATATRSSSSRPCARPSPPT